MLLFNDEDKRELLEEVSIYNVCDFLGIEYQNTGCRKSILCPDHLNHNDQHYGSCFIYENTNTAHCFVCNKSFDTIDLLRLNGYGYYDALCQLANLSGSLSRFEKQPDKKQFWLPNLTKEERELIGLYPTKRIKLYYAIQENKPDDRKYDIIFGKEGEDNSFLLYKTLKYNPWFMLQEKNPEGYLSMVLHIAQSVSAVRSESEEQNYTFSYSAYDPATYDGKVGFSIRFDKGFYPRSLNLGDWTDYKGELSIEVYHEKNFLGKETVSPGNEVDMTKYEGCDMIRILYGEEETNSVKNFTGMILSGEIHASESDEKLLVSADCFGTDAEGENETFCHSSIRTNCRYSIPDKPDVSLSKNTLKYGESTEMYIKNLGSSGNTDIDHQEFKMNIPARLDIEKIKMPEFDNADVELYINGKKVEVENGEYIPEKAVASIELMIRTKEQTFKQTSDMSFILKNSVDTKGSENLQAFSKTVCANKTTFKVYSESLNIKFEKENVKDDDKNNNDGKDDDAKKDDDKKDDNGKEPSKPSVPTTPVTPTPIPNPSDNNTPVTPSPNDKNKKEEEKKNKKPVKIVDNTGLSLKKAKVTSNKGAVYDFTSNDTKSVASIMKDGTNMDNETKIENDIPDNSTEEKNNLEEEMEKVKEKKAQNPVKKVKNNRFAKVAIVGGIVLSACIIASYFLLRTPKEETRKGGVDDKKNND